MRSRFKIGVDFFKQTLVILKHKKSLLVLPLISCVFSLIAFAVIMIPAGINAFIERLHEQALTNVQWGIFAGFFILFLLIASFITIFFNAALTACALQLMKGQDCKISDGIKIALKRIHVIFLWSLVATTFGLLMQIIENVSKRWRVLEMIIAGVLSFVWSIAVFFVIPTLVIENLGPIKAFKRSVQLMKATWGPSLVSAGSMGLLMLPFFVIALLPLLLGVYFHEHMHILFVDFIATMIMLMIVTLFSTTLQTVLRSGLYLFATGSTDLVGYDPELLKNAFRPKKSSVI